MGVGDPRRYTLSPWDVARVHSHLIADSVLFLFGAGTILHRVYRRWVGVAPPTEDSQPPTEDSHVHTSPSRASRANRAMKVSFPASGVTKGRVHVGQDTSPSMSPSNSKTMPVG